ncbi:RNA-binding domain-containing protein [Adhaeribacter radiodurans]|uniref:Putative DNA binding domain-containing protein n=1 Tax=Adhaeribacter radiodurans TaxID=2745197 RepID=A0A7L7LET2_9BACT|nr:RNA-binding domain-containing protein [Adhaeribacter radiodurans]QMU31366.1 putative DNA binding domain-containing protein [Adhaeribacter radiodurans]
MALPVNIEALVHGKTIEWERLEFKQGWNPEDIIHSLCAFANDLQHWDGGYIIVGVAENNGQPVLPPAGLQQNQIDAIQGEIVQLGHKIQPNYFPITQPYLLQDKHILVLWCPAGDNRPYTAPTTLGSGAQRQSYVRVGSRSIIARDENLRRLQELTARIPFDDRVNNQATLQDLDLGLIQAHLQEVKSDLFAESTTIPFKDLCRSMLIAKGPYEDLRPVNVGLLFFSKEPDRFFPRAWIELVWHKDGSGKNYTEHYFKGPLQKQLRDTLSFLRTNIIGEQVIKYPDKAEADRFFNFPYNALEEALSNAVYHKSYELGSPIEVQVWPDKIEILNHPGPVPPVNATILSTHRRIVAREYRNRRIGDVLKELRLTEGRGTGLPTIYDAMEANGSPVPIFATDEQTYVLVTLPVHPQANASNIASNNVSNQVNTHSKANAITFRSLEDIVAFSTDAGNQASNGVSNEASNQVKAILNDRVHDRVKEMLYILTNRIKSAELFRRMGLTNQTKNRVRYLDPLVELGWVELEYPKEKTSPKQRYQITDAGKRILNLIT